MSDGTQFNTIYAKNEEKTGEIFKIINFSNLEKLTMFINLVNTDYEYIINF